MCACAISFNYGIAYVVFNADRWIAYLEVTLKIVRARKSYSKLRGRVLLDCNMYR